MFSLKALRHAWRHGQDAVLTTQVPHVPAKVEEPTVTEIPWRDPPSVPSSFSSQGVGRMEPKSSDKIAPENAPFFIVAGDEPEEQYKGAVGRDARQVIEELRAAGIAWTAYRNGQLWDWGPR